MKVKLGLHEFENTTHCLRIFALPDTVFYAKSKQSYFEALAYLETEGKGYSTEVIKL